MREGHTKLAVDVDEWDIANLSIQYGWLHTVRIAFLFGNK